MNFSREAGSTRLNVAFLCDRTRGVYTPIPQRLECEFFAPSYSLHYAKPNGVLDGGTLYGALPAQERVSALRLFAEGDPYEPDAHSGEAYSLDGYSPECAYELAMAFLGCVASGYEPQATIRQADGAEYHHIPRWQKAPTHYWIDAPPGMTEPAQRLQFALERRSRRGIQAKGGAFSGTLPGILVLPVIVAIEAEGAP